VDPAPLRSSSDEGPTTGLNAGLVENVATAFTSLEKKEETGVTTISRTNSYEDIAMMDDSIQYKKK